MCLIFFAHRSHPRFRLILAANRDEFYRRPTTPAHRWEEPPGIVAGRDDEGGGTWLGVNDQGRWAALTNFRDRDELAPHNGQSRGLLVTGMLTDRQPLAEGFARLARRAVPRGPSPLQWRNSPRLQNVGPVKTPCAPRASGENAESIGIPDVRERFPALGADGPSLAKS